MALTLSAQDMAIGQAIKANAISIEECWSERFAEAFWAIKDPHGTIETHLDKTEAEERISAIRERLQ